METANPLPADALAHALNCVPHSIAVLAVDGEVLAANRSWQQLHSGPPGSSNNYFDLCRRLLNDEERGAEACAALELLGAHLGRQRHRGHRRYPRRAGRVADSWFELRVEVKPELDLGHFIVSHIDITEHHRRERELAARIAHGETSSSP